MPIPARTQSVSKKSKSRLPTHDVASRQVQVNRGNQETVDDSKTRSEVVSSTGSDDRISTPQIRTTAPISATRIKPPIVPQRNVSTSSMPLRPTRSVSKKVSVSGVAATAASSGLARQPSESNAALQNRHMNSGARSRVVGNAERAVPTTALKSGLRAPSDVRVTNPRRLQETSVGDLPAVSTLNSAKLRDELFQLQLVFQGSQANLDAYRHSVRDHGDGCSQRLLEDQTTILELERVHHDTQSSITLRKWLDDNMASTDAQQIQLLSRTVQDLTDLRYDHGTTKALNDFDEWLRMAVEIQQERKVLVPGPSELIIITRLGDQWHQRMSRTQQVLLDVVASFRHLGGSSDNSGLHDVLGQHTLLATTLLDEVQTAIGLEGSILKSEDDWTRQQLERVLRQHSTESNTDDDHAAKTGIWTR